MIPYLRAHIATAVATRSGSASQPANGVVIDLGSDALVIAVPPGSGRQRKPYSKSGSSLAACTANDCTLYDHENASGRADRSAELCPIDLNKTERFPSAYLQTVAGLRSERMPFSSTD